MPESDGAAPGFSREKVLSRNAEQIKVLCPAIPKEVELGYHFCFGTLGSWPRFAPNDLSGAVELANAFIEASGRRVDWVHLPILDRSDEAFFGPLAKLRPHDARVSCSERFITWSAFARGRNAARKALPNFGLAAYCGFGRLPPAQLDSGSERASRRRGDLMMRALEAPYPRSPPSTSDAAGLRNALRQTAEK